MDEGAWLFINMERCCQSQLLAESAGSPSSSVREAAVTHSQLATHEAGWIQFQPLWDRITREQRRILFD